MRATLLCLCLAAVVCAQRPEVTFQQVAGVTFAGYAEDARAEKVWEASAQRGVRGAEEDRWDMEMLELRSFRGGKPVTTFTSPAGRMMPARRSAQGDAALLVRSATFNLTGRGWTWRSTPTGDSFAILAEVVAELDLDQPAARRLRLQAPRLDATPVAGGTLMVFTGGVVAERLGERTTCERLECVVSDGPDGDTVIRSLVGSGRVVRVQGKQTLRGDAAVFYPRDDSAELVGRVELAEPEVQGTAQRLRHFPRQGLTELFAADDQPVRLRLSRPAEPPADVTGDRITLRRAAEAGLTRAEVDGNAGYVSGQSHLNARRLVATESRVGGQEILAEGGTSGVIEGSRFEAGQARWDRRRRLVDLAEKPRLWAVSGLEAAGFALRFDAREERVEIRSGPGVRAAVRLPGETPASPPGTAEADQIVADTEGDVMQLELLGAVRYLAGGQTAESAQMVAFALRPKPTTEFSLHKAILTGDVRFGQPGMRCAAERIDLSPAVDIEEIFPLGALVGRPRLLTLSGGAGETRPRLFIGTAGGRSAEFIADAHEVLVTPALTKFFLRGAVSLLTQGTAATCDLLEGTASPDQAGQLVARQIVGRGNVVVVAAGASAKGRTLEMRPDTGVARLMGDALLLDRQGNAGVPAKEVTFDMRTKAWRMDSAPDDLLPGQVVRPKIFLGRDFTLPQVKTLDNGR